MNAQLETQLTAWRQLVADNHKVELAHIDCIIKDHAMPLAATLWRDIRPELPTSPGPYHQAALDNSGGWWQRALDQIDGVTIHHTLSHSPHATAAHYITKGNGRPTIPYTFWITSTGEILQCVALEQGLWHDHTGHQNTHLSIGLAGKLHVLPPPDSQLDAAIALCAWAVETLPGVTGIKQVAGHDAYVATTCPGWHVTNWVETFYNKLEKALRR